MPVLHRCNNHTDRRRLVPNFLAVVFKKQEISQQVVTRMQDLALSFRKFSGGDTPGPSQREGRPPPAPNTQPGLWLCAGHKRPGVGTQTLVSLNFSAVVASLLHCCTAMFCQ